MIILYLLLSAAAGYLLGSLNSSLLLGLIYKIDIRKYGSGNAGMTNTLRTIGKKAAAFVTLGDILKGIAACSLGMLIDGRTGVIAGGAACVIGHNWPVFFGFRGGKGVLTSAAVVFFIDWKAGLIALLVFLIMVIITRYVSLGSIMSAITIFVYALITAKDIQVIVFMAALGILVILRHQKNIKRLIEGTESKIGKKKG